MQLGQIMDKKTKTKNNKTKKTTNNCHFWRARSKSRVSGVKAGTCPLHSTPPKGWANHLSHPSDSTHGHTLPSPHIRNQLTPRRSEQGSLLLAVAPPLLQQGPSKALSEFLVWPPVDFYWLGKAKNLVDISINYYKWSRKFTEYLIK